MQDAVTSERMMALLEIPEASRDYVADSWARGEPSLYGRFDFAYDGAGPAKLYEYNADTPTSIFETAVFQWLWLEDRIADGTSTSPRDSRATIAPQARTWASTAMACPKPKPP